MTDPGRGWERDSESVSFVYPAGPGRRFPDGNALEREVALLAGTLDLTFRTLPLNRIDR